MNKHDMTMFLIERANAALNFSKELRNTGFEFEYRFKFMEHADSLLDTSIALTNLNYRTC